MYSYCKYAISAKSLKSDTPPPENTLYNQKRNLGGGKFQKIRQRVFSGGASAGLPAQALGLSLHDSAVLLEIGSDLVVKSHQKRTISEITARMGGFFAGGAQRLPVGFQGGDLKLPPRQVGVLFCFLAAKAAPLRGKIKADTTYIEKAFCLALIAVSYNF